MYTIPWGSYHYYSNFTDKENEALIPDYLNCRAWVLSADLMTFTIIYLSSFILQVFTKHLPYT